MNPILKGAAAGVFAWLAARFIVACERERAAQVCEDVAREWHTASGPAKQAAIEIRMRRVPMRRRYWHPDKEPHPRA